MTEKFTDLVVKVLAASPGPMMARDVAKELHVKPQAVARAMGWLEKAGTVKADFEVKKVRTEYGSYSKPKFGTYKYSLKDAKQ